MFLTDLELHDLTGYRRHAEQVRWLRKNGVRHFIRKDGAVRVLRSELEAGRDQRTVSGPRFEALRG